MLVVFFWRLTEAMAGARCCLVLGVRRHILVPVAICLWVTRRFDWFYSTGEFIRFSAVRLFCGDRTRYNNRRTHCIKIPTAATFNSFTSAPNWSFFARNPSRREVLSHRAAPDFYDSSWYITYSCLDSCSARSLLFQWTGSQSLASRPHCELGFVWIIVQPFRTPAAWQALSRHP